MNIVHILLLLVAILIITALAIWAWKLTKKVKEQEKAILDQVNAKHDKIIESIRVIANAYEDKQVELIEASIRLKVLLDNLPVSEEEKAPYAVFTAIYNKVGHIPTHENWKALSRKEKRVFEQEMKTVEEEFNELFSDAAKQLKNHTFDINAKIKR
jgi:hypothetical protein